MVSRSPPVSFPRNLRDGVYLAVYTELLDVFNTRLLAMPARVSPMKLRVDLTKWHMKANKHPCRPQTIHKQDEARKQTTEFRELNICETSTAEFYSQIHLTPQPFLKGPFKVIFLTS